VVSQPLAQGAAVRVVNRNPDAAKLPAGVEVVRGTCKPLNKIGPTLEIRDDVTV
jgi:hypothetical protein